MLKQGYTLLGFDRALAIKLDYKNILLFYEPVHINSEKTILLAELLKIEGDTNKNNNVE